MKDEDRTKKQLIAELTELRKHIAELEHLETERRQAVKALEESEEKYRSLVESTEDSIYLVDRSYRYHFMNKKHMSRLQLSENQFLGKTYSDFHSPEETKWFVAKIKKVFRSGQSVQHEYRSLRDGRYYLQTLSPVKGQDGATVAVTVVSKDITERRHMEEELHALSLTDELTGLYNRRGFITMAEQQLKMANRLKRGLFMLYADVDGLKRINDTLGHKQGDMLLIETAKILKENYRESDIIARIGGDEFVVMPVGTNGDMPDRIVPRLPKYLKMSNDKETHSYELSLSVGIAYYDPLNPCSIDEFLVQADALMYEQKRNNRYQDSK